jgi:hypothetical protein
MHYLGVINALSTSRETVSIEGSKMRRAFWLLPLLFLAVVGCMTMGYTPPAASPLASAESDAQAKQFAPPAGKGNVYVVGPNNEFVILGKPTAYALTVDGKQVGGLVGGMYYCFSLGPGQHTMSASAEVSISHVTVNVEAGKNYFYQLNKENAADNTVKVSLGWVPIEAAGKHMVQGSKLGQAAIE